MSSGAYDELMTQIRNEFADEAEDNLNVIDVILGNIDSGVENGKDAIIKIKRPAHSLKGSSGVADFPLVTIIMHRLEDYLSGIQEIKKEHIPDIQEYISLAREYSDVKVDQRAISTADLVRKLPAKQGNDKPGEQKVQQKKDIEAMLVTTEKTAAAIFEREIRAHGVRVNTVKNSFQAIEMAVRARPNIIMVSGVLDVLTGVDVAAALHVMPTTSNIPVCLLTSFERGHPDLKGLPNDIELILKNHMKDDLDRVLKKFKLI